MSNITTFNHDFFGTLRILHGADGEPLFFAKDAAVALGYRDPKEAVRQQCRRRKALREIKGGLTPPLHIHPQTQLIPESDLYRLIMRSQLPSAERFQDWVMEDVLPSIRKHGGYVMGQEKLNVEGLDPQFVADTMKEAMHNMASKFDVEMKKVMKERDDSVHTLESTVSTAQDLKVHQVVTMIRQSGIPINMNAVKKRLAELGYLYVLRKWNGDRIYRVKFSTGGDEFFYEKIFRRPSGKYQTQTTYEVGVTPVGVTKMFELARAGEFPFLKGAA